MHWPPVRPSAGTLLGALLVTLAIPACAPAPRPGSLAPTLAMIETAGGALVAMQNGMPVPTFDPQPGRAMSLDGRWRVQPVSVTRAGSEKPLGPEGDTQGSN